MLTCVVLSKGFEPSLTGLTPVYDYVTKTRRAKFENFPFVIFDLPKLRVEPKIHQEFYPRVCMLSLYIRMQRLYLGIKALTVDFFSLSSKSFHVMYLMIE
jgi:hypothetical protein